MDRRTLNHYAMMRAVQQSLDANNAVWNALPVFTQQKNELDALIIAIEEHRTDAQQRSQGTTEGKNILKRQLAEKAARLSGILKAYASINDNTELADKAGLSRTYFENQRDMEFPKVLDVLADLLREHETALDDYGIAEAQITELETSIDDFRQMVGLPRQLQSSRNLAKQEATDGVNQAMDLLNNKIDELMHIYQVSNPEFYASYHDARVIVDN